MNKIKSFFVSVKSAVVNTILRIPGVRFVINTSVADYAGLVAMKIAHLKPHSDAESYIYAFVGVALYTFAAILMF